VDAQPLADDLRDRQPRRQARIRVLKDDLHLAAERPQPALSFMRDVAALEADAALGIEEAQQRKPQGRLARAAFADHPEGRAGTHLKRDAVYRLHVALDPAEQATADREPDLDLVPFDQHRRGGVGRRHAALRLRRQEPARVRVLWSVENVGGRSVLDDLTLGHHANPLGHVPHDRQIVGDQ